MLKFKDENDFPLVEKWKENDDGTYSWWYQNSNGIIRNGLIRTHEVQTGTEQIQVGETDPIYDDEGVEVTPAEPIYEEQPVYETQEIDVYAVLEDKILNGEVALYQPTQEEIDAQQLALKASLKGNIDHEAGKVRAKYVSQGDFIQEEYRVAYEDVKEWRAGGSVEADAPDTLLVWSNAAGMTLEDAAVNIETTATQFDTLLKGVRALRLQGKAAVEAAESDLEVVAQAYIDQLRAL